MSEPIAQRTLVKSPPELWAEISDVEALARHLGAFGEIRITRVVPETTVSWEGDTARGTVELSASGWGTKVTLRATATGAPVAAREPAGDQPAITSPSDAGERILGPPSQEPHWAASVEQKVRDRYIGAALPVAAAAPEPASAPIPTDATPIPTDATPSPPAAAAVAPSSPFTTADAPSVAATEPTPLVSSAPPRGFLARIRWWFGTPADDAATPATTPAKVKQPDATQTTETESEREPAPDAERAHELRASKPPQPEATDDAPTVLPFPSAPPLPEPLPEPLPAAATHTPQQPLAAPAADAAPEPVSTPSPEPVDEGTIVGILTGVLDELGSAHHRPFSRS